MIELVFSTFIFGLRGCTKVFTWPNVGVPLFCCYYSKYYEERLFPLGGLLKEG